jgi:drug/metabolite transporter (DMT)-like permease
MLKQRKPRRLLGALAIVAGALLLWLAPEPTFGAASTLGVLLLIAGIALELIGLTLEHRDTRRHR